MTYVYNQNRRVVRNARAIGVKGQELEDKASEILVKNWHPGMRSEGTIKHVCNCRLICITLCRISLVTEPEEFFDLMIKIMRDTREEGMFTLTTVKCDKKSTDGVILNYFLGYFSDHFVV